MQSDFLEEYVCKWSPVPWSRVTFTIRVSQTQMFISITWDLVKMQVLGLPRWSKG